LAVFADQFISSLYTTHRVEAHGISYLDYPLPKLLEPGKYTESVNDGVNQTNQYLAGRCTSETYVLAGYSQGADVVMSVYNLMSPSQKNRVLGVALFGDPRFNPAASPLDQGTFNWKPGAHGIFGQRPIPTADFQAKARSFCLYLDVICNSKLNVGQVQTCANLLNLLLLANSSCPDLYGMAECVQIQGSLNFNISNPDCPHFNYPSGSIAQAVMFLHDLIAPNLPPAPHGTEATGPMASEHGGATATKLQNGDVLVAGGQDSSGGTTATVELYHPASNSWTAVTPMSTPRQNHTATLLPDNRVLVVGGSYNWVNMGTAEIFNPATGTWTTAAHPLSATRAGHIAALLGTGRVLVAGGYDAEAGTSELYDPATNTWSSAGALIVPRSSATATLLHGGKVLLAGGTLSSGGITGAAEIFDPSKGVWTATGSMTMGRWAYAATILPDGRVLVAGGLNGPQSDGTTQASAELYNPKTGGWVAAQSMSAGRVDNTAVTLPNGQALIAGGVDRWGHVLSTTELYNPATGIWSASAVMQTNRTIQTMTVLDSGHVLIAGGDGSANSLGTAETY